MTDEMTDVEMIGGEVEEDHQVPMIIFHADCPDGFAAMTILNSCLGGGCELVEGRYGEAPPEVTGRHVWIVDFSYDRQVMENMWVVTESLSIIDHHATARDNVDWAVDTIDEAFELATTGQDFAWIDMEMSGAGMVARLCERLFDDYTAPAWVWNVEDRDLWRHVLPDTETVVLALASYPYEFEQWEPLLERSVEELVAEGGFILRYRNKLIDFALSTAYRAVIPTGHTVWIASCPYAIGSDVADVLANDSEEGWAAYYIDYGSHIRYGLRSRSGVNVREIAQTLGGGGHDKAAGFQSPIRPLPV